MADDKKSTSSWITSAIATAPIGIGLSAAIKGYKASGVAPILATNRPFATTHEIVSGMMATTASPGKAMPLKAVTELRKLAKELKYLTRDDAAKLWEQAASKVGIAPSTIADINKQLASASTTSEFVEQLSMAIGQRDSIYGQRAMAMFGSNLRTLDPWVGKGNKLEFGSIKAVGTQFNAISKRLVKHLPGISALGDKVLQEQIEQLSASMGSTPELALLSRKNLPGSTLRMTFQGGIIPGEGRVTLNVPMPLANNPNIIVRGAAQQTHYLAGQYGIVGPEGALKHSFNHAQFMVYRANEDLVFALQNEKRLTARKARNITKAFEQTILGVPEAVQSLHSTHHAGLDKYIEMRSQVMRLFSDDRAGYSKRKGFRLPRLSGHEYEDIIAAGGVKYGESFIPLWPGSGAVQMAHGTAMTIDPRGGLVPEGSNFSKGILKSLRKPGPSGAAMAAMQQDPMNKLFAWAAAKDRVPAPMVMTLYFPESEAATLAHIGIGTQGAGAISTDLWEQRHQTEIVTKTVKANELLALKDILTGETDHWGNINQVIPKGTALGNKPSGKALAFKEDMMLLEASAFTDKSQGDYIKLFFLQTTSNDTHEYWAKVYGSMKGMMGEQKPSYFRRITRRLGISGVDPKAYVYGGELKNRTLHYNQMFTALWHFARTNMDSGKAMSEVASNFVQDPAGVIQHLRSQALRDAGQHFSDDYMLSEMWKIARGGQLSPRDIGLTFGAVPKVYGYKDDDLISKLSGGVAGLAPTAEELKYIQEGYTIGVGQYWYGGPGGPGAGKMGSIEPRVFEAFSGPQWGTLGKELQSDIIDRVMHDRGHRALQQQDLLQSVISLTDPKQLEGAQSPNALTPKMLAEGVNVSLPGIGDVTIPGSESISNLAKYRTAAGTWVTPDLTGSYEDFLETAKKYEVGKVSAEEMRKQMSSLAAEAGAAARGTVSDKGGLVRGKLPGSMFLTNVPSLSKANRRIIGPDDIGITPKRAKRILRQMEKVYGEDAVAEIRERLFDTTAEGKLVPKYGAGYYGWAKRDPITGPYSVHPVRFVMAHGRGDYAFYNESELPGYLSPGPLAAEQGAEVDALAQQALRGNRKAASTLTERGFELIDSVRHSPLVGQAGDEDGDNTVAAMVTPDLEKKLAKQAQMTEDEYTIHSLRMQLMKSKAGKGEELTLRKLMAEQVTGAKGPQTALAPVSLALQQARAAINANAAELGKDRAMRALFGIEYLENVPLQGKHAAPGKASTIFDTMSDIATAVTTGNKALLHKSFEDVFAKGATAGRKSLLTAGADIMVLNRATKSYDRTHIPGLDLPDVIDTIIDSTEKFKTTGSETGTNAARLREIAIGHVAPTAQEARMLATGGLEGLSDIGSLIRPIRDQSRFAKLSSRALTVSNNLAAEGKRFLSHAKPLAMGFAASLALSSILSQPPLTVDKAALAAPTPDTTSGSGGENIPTNIHPAGQQANLPPPPAPLPPGSAYVTSQGRPMGAIVNVSGRGRGVNYNSLNAGMSSRFGNRSDVRTSLRDDRRSLTPQRLADMLKK